MRPQAVHNAAAQLVEVLGVPVGKGIYTEVEVMEYLKRIVKVFLLVVVQERKVITVAWSHLQEGKQKLSWKRSS